MKKVKVRETLLVNGDWAELSFDIDKAREHFMGVLHGDVFPQDDYSAYINIEVVIHEDDTGWSLEGVRWETDAEFEKRKIVTESKEFRQYLEYKEKFKDIET